MPCLKRPRSSAKFSVKSGSSQFDSGLLQSCFCKRDVNGSPGTVLGRRSFQVRAKPQMDIATADTSSWPLSACATLLLGIFRGAICRIPQVTQCARGVREPRSHEGLRLWVRIFQYQKVPLYPVRTRESPGRGNVQSPRKCTVTRYRPCATDGRAVSHHCRECALERSRPRIEYVLRCHVCSLLSFAAVPTH